MIGQDSASGFSDQIGSLHLVRVLKLRVHLEQLNSLGWGGNDSSSGLVQVHVWNESPWGRSAEEIVSIVGALWGGEDSLEAVRILSLVLSNHVSWLLLSTIPVRGEVHEVESLIFFAKEPKEITKFEWLVLIGSSGGSLRRS